MDWTWWKCLKYAKVSWTAINLFTRRSIRENENGPQDQKWKIPCKWVRQTKQCNEKSNHLKHQPTFKCMDVASITVVSEWEGWVCCNWRASRLLIHGWRWSGGGFRQSEIESEIATACNHALAILFQIAQLNLQCPPTGWLLFPKFNHKRILRWAIRGRFQYCRYISSCRQRFCEDYYETLFVIHWETSNLPLDQQRAFSL